MVSRRVAALRLLHRPGGVWAGRLARRRHGFGTRLLLKRAATAAAALDCAPSRQPFRVCANDLPQTHPLTRAQLVASNGHPIIGIVVIAALLLQPFGGLLHHVRYVKTQHPTIWGFIHRWTGRTMLVLGAINGGLGLDLAGQENSARIGYGVVAAFFYLLWLAVVILTEVRRR